MWHPLDSAREKLRRADEHLDALHAKAAAWLDSQPYDFYWVGPDLDAISDSVSELLDLEIHVGVVEEPPEDLGLILGDALHNLRGVLDHLFWALVSRRGSPDWEETRAISFPIAKKHETFMDRAEIKSFRRRPKGTPRSAWHPDPPGQNRITYQERLTIQRHQPYQRKHPTTHPLAVLRDLNDRDKHQAFHPVLISAEEPPPRFVAVDGVIEGFDYFRGKPLVEGAHVANVRIGERGVYLYVQVEFVSVAIAFGSPTQNVPLRDLAAIRDSVAAVLTDFVWAFPATSL